MPLHRHRISLLALSLVALAPFAARAQSTVCGDGTTTSSVGRGTCSGHGGVNAKATKKAVKRAEKTEEKAESRSAGEVNRVVTCTDGTTSGAGRGACSHHGGVASVTRTTRTTRTTAPSLPASVSANSPARERSQAKSRAPSATTGGSGVGEDNNPVGAIARCKDGLYSHAAHRRGACSRHGGVATWLGQ